MRLRLSVGSGGLAAALVVATALVGTPAPAATPTKPTALRYVALGDSSAAGPILLPQQPDQPQGCFRSAINWPNLAAQALDVQLRDASCSGAKVADMTSPQTLRALTPDTDLVTVTVGANDVGLVDLALRCIRVLPSPLGLPALPVVGTLPLVGTSCAEAATTGGVDTYAEKVKAVEPAIGVMLAEIHSRAPKAYVFVVGYGTYLRSGGCWPLWPQDADYLQATVNRLDDAMARQATAHAARFIDVRPASVGHDICAEETARYYEPYLPDASNGGAVLLHPKPLGMRAIAQVVENAVRAGRPHD